MENHFKIIKNLTVLALRTQELADSRSANKMEREMLLITDKKLDLSKNSYKKIFRSL